MDRSVARRRDRCSSCTVSNIVRVTGRRGLCRFVRTVAGDVQMRVSDCTNHVRAKPLGEEVCRPAASIGRSRCCCRLPGLVCVARIWDGLPRVLGRDCSMTLARGIPTGSQLPRWCCGSGSRAVEGLHRWRCLALTAQTLVASSDIVSDLE